MEVGDERHRCIEKEMIVVTYGRLRGMWNHQRQSQECGGHWTGGFHSSGRCCQVASGFFNLAVAVSISNSTDQWLDWDTRKKLFIFHASVSNHFPSWCPRKLTPFWGGPALVLPLHSAVASVSLCKWLMGWTFLPGEGGRESYSSLTN